MVDTLASGASECEFVKVRIFSSAPTVNNSISQKLKKQPMGELPITKRYRVLVVASTDPN